MRTILAIIFMTLATQASAWSENVTRTEANALEDLITLPSGVSFHIPNYLEFDDGFLNQVNRKAQVENLGAPAKDPMYFAAILRLNLKEIFRINISSAREQDKVVSQTNIASATEDNLSSFFEAQKQYQKQYFERVGFEQLDFTGRKNHFNDKYYLTASSLYKVNNPNFSELPYRVQEVTLYYFDLENSFIATFRGLSDLQGEVTEAVKSFFDTLKMP